MAKLHGCRVCHVELERIALANGEAMLFCAVCDAIGDERHMLAGARPGRAGMTRKPLKLVVSRPRTVVVKKIMQSGRKSLTA